jgi:hypothetical protein
MVQPDPPLVSIGIPAYNRPSALQRAIRSALAQNLDGLEVIVSDDASPDRGVEVVGRELAAEDKRLRYVRQPHNLGHARNYAWVLSNARGRYFMWLADDDWIDPGYVSSCLRVLQAEGVVLACGQACYYMDEQLVFSERPLQLLSARPGLRVLRYYGLVNLNGPLFGLARRDDLVQIGFTDLVGGDWLLVGTLAGRGAVVTLHDVHIHRSAAGLGADPARLVESFGISRRLAGLHHLLIAGKVWREIARPAGIVPAIGPTGRTVLATVAALAVAGRFTGAGAVRAALGRRRADHLERWVGVQLDRISKRPSVG